MEFGVSEREESQKMREGLIVLSAAGSTQEQNREVATEFGNMEVICGHNPRAALAGILRMEAQLEWLEERMESEKVETTFSRCFAVMGSREWDAPSGGCRVKEGCT